MNDELQPPDTPSVFDAECLHCGEPITLSQWPTAVQITVPNRSGMGYRHQGPYHEACAKEVKS